MTKESLGFSAASPTEHKKDKGAVERTFSPEFRNRLDAWITVGPLQPVSIAKVVDKFVKELEATLKEKNVVLDVSEDARVWLAEHVRYEKLYGARPMARLIKNELKKPLAEAILFGELVHGGACRVAVKENELALTYGEASAKPVVEKRGARACLSVHRRAKNIRELVGVLGELEVSCKLSRRCACGA